jgi:hypothetical protein
VVPTIELDQPPSRVSGLQLFELLERGADLRVHRGRLTADLGAVDQDAPFSADDWVDVKPVAFVLGGVCLGVSGVLVGRAIAADLPVAIIAGLAVAALGIVGVGYGLGRPARNREAQGNPEP